MNSCWQETKFDNIESMLVTLLNRQLSSGFITTQSSSNKNSQIMNLYEKCTKQTRFEGETIKI
jgi:hypothetical protein